MRRAVIAAVAALALSSCGFTPQGDLIRDAVKAKGAQAYDEGLENAEWFICYAASVGAVRRKYGRDAQTAQAYNAICAPAVDILGREAPR